jgi:hypothetical protein
MIIKRSILRRTFGFIRSRDAVSFRVARNVLRLLEFKSYSYQMVEHEAWTIRLVEKSSYVILEGWVRI